MTSTNRTGVRRAFEKDEAYRRLKTTIFSDDDPERIYSERSLSKRLNIGLSPIRSAIERMKLEGLIVVLPNAGFLLRPLSPTEIADFYEVRTLVEAHIVSMLTGRITTEEIAALEKTLDEQAACVRTGNARDFYRFDMAFHVELARIHGNQEMIRILERLEDRMYHLAVGLNGKHTERLKTLIDQHREILEEITSGTPQIAQDKLTKHLEWGRIMIVSGGRDFGSISATSRKRQ